MIKDNELTRKYAEELSRLILENPQLRVIMWINSDGISDEYSTWCGYLGKPEIIKISISADGERTIEQDGDAYEDCYNYYGDVADEWNTDELKQKARAIEWEKVIAVNVGAV